jgi:hypothetical protein
MRKLFTILVVSLCLLVGSSASQTLSPAAFACSIAAPSPNSKFVRFIGKAVKHELIIDAESPTYRWTFVISKWDKSSQAKQRKRGSRIRVSVVEAPPVGATTTVSPTGVINSCAGVQLGTKTVYKANQMYDVTAAEAQSVPGAYYVTYYVGLLLSK